MKLLFNEGLEFLELVLYAIHFWILKVIIRAGLKAMQTTQLH